MDVSVTGVTLLMELVTIVLAASLATERLVTIIRTPQVLGQIFNLEQAQEKDGPRRLRVQLLSFMCAWTTCAFLSSGNWDPFGVIDIGQQGYPVWFVAFLAMGGSSFWKNLLGYTKAARDVRRNELAEKASRI